jgi:hypothetical protein
MMVSIAHLVLYAACRFATVFAEKIVIVTPAPDFVSCA